MKKDKKNLKTNKSIKHKENSKEKAAKQMSPEIIAQALRKWLTDGK